jgi:tetratricopeptide (TPR) repeat protein
MLLGAEAMEADKRDDVDRAIEICDQQLAIDPTYQPALAHLLSLYLEDDRNDEAKAVVSRIIEADPNDPKRRVLIGSIFLHDEREREAEEHFKKALEIEPGDECLHNIGKEFLDAENHKKAIKYFKRVSGGAPAEMFVDIAMALVDHGELVEAARLVEKAVKSHPQDVMLRAVRAIVFVEEKDLESAEKEIAAAEQMAKEQNDASARETIKMVRERIEDIKEMEEMLKGAKGKFKGMPDMPPELQRIFLKMIKGL